MNTDPCFDRSGLTAIFQRLSTAEADLGEGARGGGRSLLQGFLWYFFRNPFLADRHQYFSKGALYTNFEKEARAVKIFQKVPKSAFFGLFLQNFACDAENLANTGIKPCLGRAQKIISVDLKKRSTKFSKNV